MDIKDLNKTQLILLALLLSFVASIATSITTVTLMQQAPPSITMPINRVIQQTVEKIQQVEGKTTVQTVIIKEEDLVVDAIAKNQAVVFYVTREMADDTGKLVEFSAGKAFAVNVEGILVADATLVPSVGIYYVKNSSGKFKAEFLNTQKEGFSFLKIGAPLDEKNKLVITLPVFGDIDAMKAGHKILVLGSNISSLIFDGNKDIRLSVNKSSAGSMVLNLNGEVIGIALFGENPSFVSINSILSIAGAKETFKDISKTP